MDKPWFNFYEPEVPQSLNYPSMPLNSFLEDSARKYPDHVAVNFILKYIAGERIAIAGKMTYRQLNAAVDRFARALYDLGVRKGDRVALMLPNSPQFVIGFFGTTKIGGIVVNTNPTYTARELEHQLKDSGAETIVLLNLFYQRLEQVRPHTQVRRAIVSYIYDFIPFPFSFLVKSTQQKEAEWAVVTPGPGVYLMKELIKAAQPNPPHVEVKSHDVALFQYTGGTTGVPKAAMLSHHNLVANTLQVNAWLTTAEEGKEKCMAAIPFFHVYGMTVAMLFGVKGAAELLIIPNPRELTHVMDVIQKERASIFPGVPAMYNSIINHPRAADYDLRSIKACISGSAPLPMEVQEKFGEITGGRLVEGYGLTEAAPVTHCNPIYGHRKSGSIGIPMPDVGAKIVSLDTGADGNVGERGELVIKGPQVMVGYYNMPGETRESIDEEGWLHTGDIATMDEEGYFYIVDRKKEMILSGGYNIYPREIEEVLYAHPKVKEAAAIGIPHPEKPGEERVKVFVVPKDGVTLTEEEIMQHCQENLARYKWPRSIEFRQELPKTMVGKVLRRVLAEEEKAKTKAGAPASGPKEQIPAS
jgi:long-chain acyl-CoA synthetase